MSRLKIACIQTNTGADEHANINALNQLMRAAAGEGAQLILTPECSDNMIWPSAEKIKAAHHQDDHPTLRAMQDLAAELGVWIVIGSLGVRAPDTPNKLRNRSFVIDDQGALVQIYDKIHLFDATLSAQESYRESIYYEAGQHHAVVQTPLATLGLTICYDLRFPALHRSLAQNGAQILTVPAAFSVPTGQAHWEILLRARAIETGCFVMAAGQTGTHPGARQTYGHSMIIDPWGQILTSTGQGEGYILADIDLNLVQQTRTRIPAIECK